jgi:hypothetical protein
MRIVEQPEWLRRITSGLVGGRKTRVLLENERYAIVQSPGANWSDNGGVHYGATAYYLVDKQANMRNSVGLLDCREIQSGGRAKLAQWKGLLKHEDQDHI